MKTPSTSSSRRRSGASAAATGRVPSPPPVAEGGAVLAGLSSRWLAWRVLQRVGAGAHADAALERELLRSPLPDLDRALATEIAYGAIRQRRLLDAWVDAHARIAAERQPPALRWLLHLGLYQILFTARVPAAAAVSTSVELSRRVGLERLAPVVNGILRAVLRTRQSLPQSSPTPWDGLVLPADPAIALAVCQSLPDWLAVELLQWLPPDRAQAFGRAANATPALDLRVNRLRTSVAAQMQAFAEAGIATATVSGCPDALSLPRGVGDLRALPGYGEGFWCVQDRHAQAVVPLLAPRPGERILDACAAPGGKTTQIAEWLEGQGEVWAVDRSEARLRRLQANAARLGLAGIQPLALDATTLAAARPDWIGGFDRILLDAPCSGLGTLARHADARWRVSPDAIAELAELQDRLLAGLAPLLAPSGRLVYATCTLHPCENQARIAAFLAAHPDWRLQEQRTWWPQEEGGDGFFAAVLEAPAVREGAEPKPAVAD